MRLSHVVWLRQKARVMADPGFGVWLVLLDLVGPRSFEPSLANTSWAARHANYSVP
jgi:hypothetical protein